jgi:paraquat-inducible protein A
MNVVPRAYPDLLLCEHCDEVYERRALRRGEVLFCSCCGSRLEKEATFSLSTWLALTVTAACLFVFANAFPVAVISFGGLQNQATIWQSILALTNGPGVPMAIAAGIVTIGIPGFQIALLLWLLGFSASGRACPGFVPAMRLLHLSRPWGMTEVFLLGVLVAIVKLSSYLHVVVGLGVLSIALLAPLMVVITNHDSQALWRQFEGR